MNSHDEQNKKLNEDYSNLVALMQVDARKGSSSLKPFVEFLGRLSHKSRIMFLILILLILGIFGGNFFQLKDGVLVFEGRKIVRAQYQYLASKPEFIAPYQPEQAVTCFSLEDVLDENVLSTSSINNIFCTQMDPSPLVLSDKQEFENATMQGKEATRRNNVFALLLIQEPRIYPDQDKNGTFELVAIVDVSEDPYDKDFINIIRPQDMAMIKSDETVTEDWLTYHNTEDGYILKYPPDWSIDIGPSWWRGDGVFRTWLVAPWKDPGHVEIVFQKGAYKKVMSQEDFAGALKQKSLFLNGFKGVWVVFKAEHNTCQSHHYYFSRNEIDLYEVSYWICPDYHPPTLDQLYIDIANTFMLTEIKD